jgi:GTP-binding protein
MSTTRRLPVVAVVGRPNVGKSTLFNRIAGMRRAIVHDQPGVTRDRLYHQVEWGGIPFMLVDTGGFDSETETWDAKSVREQVLRALEDADRVIFVVDGRGGLIPQDKDVAVLLRKGGRKVLLAVNKIDHPSRETLGGDFARLGFDPIHQVSAEHGLGVAELLDAVVEGMEPPGDEEEGPSLTRIALVGRPNVGKSTLANRLLGEERFITHHEPGTTRDAIDTPFSSGGRDYILVDTAGIRRRGKVREAVEKFSVYRAQDAVGRADLCLLVIDALELVTEQDAKVAGLIQQAQRACIILVNKWDLVEGGDRGAAERVIRESLQFMEFAPVIFTSGKTGFGLNHLPELLAEVSDHFSAQIPAPALNDFLWKSVNAYKPASFHGKVVTFGYMTQAKTKPPTFVVLVNDPERVHLTYRRYLANRMRDDLGLVGVPFVLRFRAKKK